jgi:outer membrane protein assembly factor BamB
MTIMKRLFCIILLSIICIGVNAQDVAQWRGPDRNGIYNEPNLLKKWPDGGPKLLWHFDELGEGHTSASVTNSGVYTTGMIDGNGFIYAFDLKGKLLWKREYGKEWNESYKGIRSTPLVVKDKIYIFSAYGQLLCLKSSNGETIWTLDITKQYNAPNIKWGLTENLLFDGNVLYCTTGGTTTSMVALDRNTGNQIWKSESNGENSAYGSPILIKLKDRKIIVTMMQKSICGFDAATGASLWRVEHINATSVHPNIPIYIDGSIYCTSGYGKGGVMLKLSDDGGSVTKIWENSSLDPKVGGVVVLDGRIYGGGDRGRKFFCLDWLTGKEIFSVSDLAPANIIADGGLLYIYSESGKISLAEPKSDGLNIISSFSVPFGAGFHWAHLVINNKCLYVRHNASLMVYDIAAN